MPTPMAQPSQKIRSPIWGFPLLRARARAADFLLHGSPRPGTTSHLCTFAHRCYKGDLIMDTIQLAILIAILFAALPTYIAFARSRRDRA